MNNETINQKVIYFFIGIISFIFLIGSSAGAYSYKKGQFSFYKENIINISKKFTEIIPNLLKIFNDVFLKDINEELVKHKKNLKSNYPHRAVSENYLYQNLVKIKESIGLLK